MPHSLDHFFLAVIRIGIYYQNFIYLVPRTVHAKEIDTIYTQCIAPRVSGVNPHCLKTTVCLYTVTPDEGFVIDHHPDSEKVVVASPCSGHGFKHSAAVGELLAQLVLDGSTSFDISVFSFDRFKS